MAGWMGGAPQKGGLGALSQNMLTFLTSKGEFEAINLHWLH